MDTMTRDRRQGMKLADAFANIDAATERFCTVVEAMPDIEDSGKSLFSLAVSWYSADVKSRISKHKGMEYGWNDFLGRDSAGRLLRRSPEIGDAGTLDARMSKKVQNYVNRLNRYSDILMPKYVEEMLVMSYLRKVSCNSAKIA